MFDLSSKTALVTGASGGIGSAIAKNTHNNLVATEELHAMRGPRGNVDVCRYDAVCPQHADREVGDAHRTPFASAAAPFATEKFPHHRKWRCALN